jgi:hypothetical protein
MERGALCPQPLMQNFFLCWLPCYWQGSHTILTAFICCKRSAIASEFDYRASPVLDARFLCIVESPWDQDNMRSLAR